jgi:hypothetical protein
MGILGQLISGFRATFPSPSQPGAKQLWFCQQTYLQLPSTARQVAG